ncbi:MAG: hypothetical protein ACYCZD_12865 [Rhodanobacter sp.]
MSIKNLLVDVGVLVAVAGMGFGTGYVRGHVAGVKSDNAQVLAAGQKIQLANAQRDAANTTLANVRRSLDDRKHALELANYFADAALRDRAALQRQLTAATVARDAALRKAAHESPDCAALARQPVCPAVAERLWGSHAAGAAASARH